MKKKRILSWLMAIAIVISSLPISALLPTSVSADELIGQVRVIVENTTFTETVDGVEPDWTGTLVDTWVDLDSESTMMSSVVAALDTVGATQVGAENNYISEINGLAAFDGGMESGWMGTLNDWFTNEGFMVYTVAADTLEDGDLIKIMYTTNGYGEDLGGSWANNDKTVMDVTFSEGELSSAFDKDTHSYILTVSQGSTGVIVTPTASNKNFQVRTSVAGTEYRRTATVPIQDGTVITVTCGDPAWPSMNNQENGAGSVPAETYTFTVEVNAEIDKTLLDLAIAEADAKAEEDYTEESYALLATALAMPEETQAEVDAKVVAINQAIAGLVEKSVAILPYYADFAVDNEEYNANIKDNWLILDEDGDGEKWTFDQNEGFTSYSWSYDNDDVLDPDNYLISPVIKVPDVVNEVRVSWGITAGDPEYFEDKYAVYIISGDNITADDISSQTPVYEETFNATTAESRQYREVYVNVSDFAEGEIRVVFRHYDTDGNDAYFITLHDVSVEKSVAILPYYADFAVDNEEYNANIKDNWLILDEDGDGEKWTFDQNEGFTSYSWSYDNDDVLDPDNYLISPVIKVPDEVNEVRVSWDITAGDPEYFEDKYAVYIISGDNITADDISSQTPVYEGTFNATTAENRQYREVYVNVSDFAEGEIRVAFRHYDTDGNDAYFITLHDVSINDALPAETPIFTTDLSTEEVIYEEGQIALDLNVFADSSDNGTMTYKWYSNTTKSVENGSVVGEGMTYTPSTEIAGTMYYYVIATNTLGGNTATETSQIATITVKTSLALAIEAAAAKAEDDYTEESYAVLAAALAMPETTQNEIDAKVLAIYQAIDGLILKTELKDKEDLQVAIDIAIQNKNTAVVSVDGLDIDPTGFWVTQAEMLDCEEAIALAEAVYADTVATESEIHYAVCDLESAISTFMENKIAGIQGLEKLTFKVGSSDNDVTFYETLGYDDDGFDLYNESASLTAIDTGTTGSGSSQFKIYQVYFSDDVELISFRGHDANGNSLGGMSVAVTDAVDGVLTLRQFEGWITTKINNNFLTEDQAEFIVKDASNNRATPGDTYTASGGENRFRFLLYAGGNAELYTFLTEPKGALRESYLANMVSNIAVSSTSSTTYVKSVALAAAKNYSITAPSEAEVQIFNQLRNYCAVEISEYSSLDNGNGTITHLFKLPVNSINFTYRVAQEGKITKAGWIPKLNTDASITVEWTETDSTPKTLENNVVSSVRSFVEESVLLNINSQNFLEMEVGDSFRLRSYRGAWQITNDVCNNILIEPDFNYTVISGSEVISITPVAEGNGNAKNNWLDIEAKQEGVAIVEISYDAIDITGPSGTYKGTYAATDPNRTGLFVVRVGSNGIADIDFGLTRTFNTSSFDNKGINRSSEWDAEFDTVYFVEETGSLSFAPNSSTGISSVEILNNPSVNDTWIPLLSDDGVYTAPIEQGNNIIKITAGERVEYQLVRGAKVEVVITNETNPGEAINPGDTVSIFLDGLYMPMPKFAGIYNPAYGLPNHRISYDDIPEEITVLSTVSGNQYNLRTKNGFTIMPEEVGEYTLNTGYIYYTMMGSDNPTGGHRLLTDQGIGANFNASQTYHVRGILPEISINVQSLIDKTQLDAAVAEASTKAEADYTEESYALLEDALAMPEETQAEVDAKVLAISQAIDGLVEIDFIVNVTPNDAIVKVYDQTGSEVEPNSDGSYSGMFGTYDYTYTVTKYGYVAKSGTVPKCAGTLNITLEEASDDGLNEVGAYWSNFRGSDNNMAISDVELPIDTENINLKWNAQFGDGWSNAPSVQIIVDDTLVVMAGTKIYKLDLESGEILATGTMVAAPNWGYTPPIYAEGMIFAPLTDGTIQAFNAETLESLWVYEDNLGGQSLSPISYDDGYIYTGFWKGEIRDANFVCLSVTDEDVTQEDESKISTWKQTVPGGFYWAGSVVIGDAVIVGSDDGMSGFDNTSQLYSFDQFTGEVISVIDIVGDQRSSIAYDATSGKIFFTTKCGYLYSASVNVQTGELSDLVGIDHNTQSTSTPIVYKGKVYVGIGSGVQQDESSGKLLVADVDSLEMLYTIDLKGYPQCSLLMTTAYEADTGYIYLYSTYNALPGGISMVKVDPDATTADGAELIELYDATGFEQYCITSLICGEDGTIYYKNDSGNVLAVGVPEAVGVIKLIDAIGTVTLDSENAIKIAINAYNALTEEQKALVSNYATLQSAIAQLSALKIAECERLINAIGTVTLDKEDTIVKARTYYTSLSDDEQKKVNNYDKLSAAEDALNELKEEQPEPTGSTKSVTVTINDVTYEVSEATANAIEVIEELLIPKAGDTGLPQDFSELTEEQVEDILSAYRAYVALTDDEKLFVENYEDFEAALNKLGEEFHYDDESGVDVRGNEVLPWNVKINVQPQTVSEEQLTAIRETLGEEADMMLLCDIHFTDMIDGNEYEPDALVTVRIPVPDSYDGSGTLTVVHIKDDGTYEYIKCTVTDGYAIFSTASFSMYGLAVFTGDLSELLSQNTANNLTWIWILLTVLAIGGLTILIFMKKRHNA